MLAAENMLKDLEGTESLDVKTKEADPAYEEEELGRVLKRVFGDKEPTPHKGIRYSDGKARESSFDD